MLGGIEYDGFGAFDLLGCGADRDSDCRDLGE